MATFHIEHELPTSVDHFWDALFLNDDFNRALYLGRLGFKRYEVQQKELTDSGDVQLTLLTEPKVSLPSSLKNLAGESFYYIETGTLHRAEGCYRFRIDAPKFKDKLQLSGELRIEALSPETVARKFTMHCKVNIFGLGKVIEGFVEKSTRESHDAAVAYTREHLAAAQA